MTDWTPELQEIERRRRELDAARAELERVIREAYDLGITLRPIAEAAGFSFETTRKIAKGLG